MSKPSKPPTEEQIKNKHILKTNNPGRGKRRTYWLAAHSGWQRSNKSKWEVYRSNKKRTKAKTGKSKSGDKKKVESAIPTTKKTTYEAKENAPTLILNWTRHTTFSNFEDFFDSTTKPKFKNLSEAEKIKHQGWYCLGTTSLLSYVGMVGQWRKKKMSDNTIYHRWKNEHDSDEKKWPSGMFQKNELRINNHKAIIHTCTITEATPNKEMSSKSPPLVNRKHNQYRLIKMIEDALIFLPALEHRSGEKSLYERNNKLDFIKRNKGGKPIAIKDKKAMINATSDRTFPKKNWYLSGDFNIKCEGKMPSQLSSIFSNGVHVKTFTKNLSKDKIRY